MKSPFVSNVSSNKKNTILFFWQIQTLTYNFKSKKKKLLAKVIGGWSPTTVFKQPSLCASREWSKVILSI